MEVLKRISQCKIVEFPDDAESPLEMLELVRQTKQRTRKMAEELDSLSLSALCAAVEYLNCLLGDYDSFVVRSNLSTRIAEEMRIKRSYADGSKDPGAKCMTNDVF